MADATIRATSESKGTVVLLNMSGGVVSFAPLIRAVVNATTSSHAVTAGEEELIEVPLELARTQHGRPRKFQP